MKYLILTTALFSLTTVSAATKAKGEVKKIIELKGHVTKLKPGKGNLYWFQMHEVSASYYSEEKFVPCLEKSMTDNKLVTLKLTSQLIVLSCSLK